MSQIVLYRDHQGKCWMWCIEKKVDGKWVLAEEGCGGHEKSYRLACREAMRVYHQLGYK